MIASAIIVFREVLEAALVISIVLAATNGVARRGRWVSLGLAAGLLGAGVVALFAGRIAAAASGAGQELFNAGVLLAAVVMLGWHNVWMGRHGRELAREINEVGVSVLAGSRPLYVLAVVTGLAILREGSEVVLFLYGILAGGARGVPMLAGSAAGLAGGVALGMAMYFGLLRVPLRHLFNVTGWLILLLAAGMAGQAAGYLVQADWLPALSQGAVWDTSRILSEHSVLGQVLHTLVGYDDRPQGIQLLFYGVTLVTIASLMRLYGRTPLAKAKRAAAAVSICALALSLSLVHGSNVAHASHETYNTPVVGKGPAESEARGRLGFHLERGPVSTSGRFDTLFTSA
jgi:high-affinity iron transporter